MKSYQVIAEMDAETCAADGRKTLMRAIYPGYTEAFLGLSKLRNQGWRIVAGPEPLNPVKNINVHLAA